MHPVYEQANSDLETILACQSSLSLMSLHVDGLAEMYSAMTVSTDERTKLRGEEGVARNASVLKEVREKIDGLMQLLGDYLSNGDAVSATMMELTTPVYALLAKRQKGVSTND